MHYVYVLKSKIKRWIYIGLTGDLLGRFREHNTGLVKSTKTYRPFELIYYEAYLTKRDARTRELRLKQHSQTKEVLLKQIKYSLGT